MQKETKQNNNLQVTTAKTVWWSDEIPENWKRKSKRQQNLTIVTFLRWKRNYLYQKQNRQKSTGFPWKASNNATLETSCDWINLAKRAKRQSTRGHWAGRKIVQQKIWILGIRNALRSIQNNCVTCRKGREQTIAPVTTNPPEERLDASTAFTNVGIDYFVPFIVKVWQWNEKRWCFLFTCLSMRAVNIEVVPKLDTGSCLNAIMRFIARRGKPSRKISDNGTNFVGAERELAEYYAAWNKEVIEEHLIQRGIRGKFNPPAAPHFRGKWERLVKSCKKTMYAMLGNRSVTEDVF